MQVAEHAPRDSAEVRLEEAFAAASRGQVDAAGRDFRYSRELLQLDFLRGNNVEKFVLAAIGEALWYGDADETTYRALDLVSAKAVRDENRGLELQERLVRANLTRRKGGAYETSIELLESVVSDGNSGDPAEWNLIIQSMVSQIDVYLQCGIEDRRRRSEVFMRAVQVLEDLNGLIQRSDDVPSVVTSSVADLHAHMIELFMKLNYSVTAYRVARNLADKYDGTTAALQMILSRGPIGIFVSEREGLWHILKPDEYTGSKKGVSLDGMMAAVREAIANARFDSQSEFWKAATLGACLGIAGAAVFFGMDFHTLLAGSGIGAAGLVTAGKLHAGITAEETRQALATGYSNHALAGNALARVAEIAAIYAFFGGPVPGVGYLADVPGLEYIVANADGAMGQFHGLGSAMAGLGGAMIHHGGDAVAFVGDRGFAGGMSAFWNQFSTTTVFGSALQASADFWQRFVSYAVNELPQDALRGISSAMSDPLSLETALRIYKAAAVGWAGATMVRPELRDRLYKNHPGAARAMEIALLPAGYLFGVDVGLATGVQPKDAYIISAIGMCSQVIYHWMSGGRIANLDLANAIRNAMVPALYAGTGAQMIGAVEAHTLVDHFMNSMGIQVGFIPIGFAHGLLLKFPLTRFWQNKAGRSFTAETIGNIGSLMLGFASWKGTFFREAMQQFVQCPWMTKVWQEPVDGASQRSAFRGLNRPVANEGQAQDGGNLDLQAKAAKGIEDQAKVAGRRWPFLQPLTGRTAVERLPMLVAYLFTFMNKDEPFPTNPEERYYRMIYRMLTSSRGNSLDATYVSQYLSSLDIVAKDLSPGRRDVRRNLLVATWAARDGVHGDAIREFFADHDWVFDHYGIDRNMETPPDGSLMRRMGQAKWFKGVLSGSTGRG